MSIIIENPEIISLRNSYLKVHDSSGNNFFGGSQMWYGKSGKKSFFDAFKKENRIRGYGCGLVAASDILLYLEYKRDVASKVTVLRYDRTKGQLVHENEEDSVASTDSGKVTSLDWGEKEYTDRLFELEKKWFHILPVAGINGLSLAHKMNRYMKKNDLPYRAKWGCGEKSIPDAVLEMLGNDIPVLIAIGPGWRKKDRLNLYGVDAKNDRMVFDELNSAKDHYVTITGAVKGRLGSNSERKVTEIKENKRRKLAYNPAGADEEKGDILFLEISSWGKKYYVDYGEYAAYVAKNDNTLFSNILYISPR